MARIEDHRLLIGGGRYTADVDMPGQLYAYFLRSDRAHARIKRIDAARARASSGVSLVLLGADVAQLAWPPCFVRYPGLGGKAILQPRRHAIALDRVRFSGELVAMAVADSAALAEDAVELIDIEYEELPMVADAGQACAHGAQLLYDDIPANTCFEYESGDAAAVSEAFEKAAHVARVTLDSQRIVGNPMEPRGCAVSAREGKYDIWLPTQGMAMMRTHLAAMLGIAPERIQLHAGDVGGGFGTRSTAEPEYAAVLLAAERLGRPVKWQATRRETFLSDSGGRGNRMHAELALDAAGAFLALRFTFLSDLGAYLTPIGAMVHSINPSMCATGVYRIPAVHAAFRQVLTNTAPVGAYRGAGRPDTAYLIERVVDEAAARFGFDPVRLRRMNFVPSDAFPYRTANGTVYDSGDFDGVLDKALALAEWQSFPGRRERSAGAGRLRGIGLACFIESSGGGVVPEDRVSLRFEHDGSVTLNVSTQSNGQGHETVFTQLAARELGISADRVRYAQSAPGAATAGSGTFGSRSLIMTGSAVVLAARKARAEGLPHSAPPPESVEVSAEMPLHRTFPNGCHIAEVEVDPDTGEVSVARYAICDDFGCVVDHALVEGQVHGGLAQGAGQALMEHCVYDLETGQLVTGTFMDYAMPRADMICEPKIVDHPVPCASNPLGAKGAGEAGTTGALPAIANALLDALRPCGVRHLDMPFTAERVWRSLQEHRP